MSSHDSPAVYFKFKMASNEKWEVVGKGGKKRTPNEGKKNRVKASDMPKAEIVNPLAESKTIYQALKGPKAHASHIVNGHVKHTSDVYEELPAVLAERVPEQAPEIKKLSGGFIGGKKKAVSTKPQKTDEELLQEALLKVDVDELTAILTNLESSFPNNPSIWLTDIGAHLQLKLKGVPQKDPTFEGKPADYPMCVMSSALKKFFLNLMKKCTKPTLKLVYQRSVENMVQDLSKGYSAYGDQIMLQFIVHHQPQITLEELKEVQEMLMQRRTRTREALTLMWCVGQLPEKDLAQGLTVWMEVMLPQLNVKHLTKYSVSYLENLLSTCKPVGNQGALVEPKEFFTVMEVAFSPASPLAGNTSLQRKLLSLYPKIKRLSLGSETRPVSRLYFGTLLSRLDSELPLEYQIEVLSCLVMCLEKDQDCFTKWESSYLATLQQSGLLLNHLINTWNSQSTSLQSKLFATVDVFQAKNRPLLENNKTKPGLDSCVKACEAIKEKKKTKKKSFFSCGKLFKLVLLLLVAVISIDVYKHKGYRASRTARIARDYGLEQAAVSGYGHAKKGIDVANSWVQTNYPTYYSKFREHADPAAAFVWEKLTIIGTFIAETTKPARDYLNVKIPQLLEKIETEGPVYLGIVRDHLKHFWDTWWPVVHKYLIKIWDFLSEHVPVLLAKVQELAINLAHKIYELAPDFFSSVATWFAKLGEKIVEKLPDVLAVIQEYVVIAINLAVNLIQSVVEWVQNVAGSAEVEDTVNQKSSSTGYSEHVPK